MRTHNYWQRRLGRRQVLRGVAMGAAGVAAAAITGCGDDDEESTVPSATAAGTPAATATAAGSPAPAAAQPKKGGTLARPPYSSSGVFDRALDPHVQPASYTGLLGLFYQTLIRENPKTFDIEAETAQKWEQPSPTELIFTLAPNIKWHNKPPANGRPLIAGDVVFSLERLRTNDPKFINRSSLAPVDRVEAVNQSTVKITLKQPDATALRSLAGFSLKIMAPEVVEKADKFATAESAVGTGAFVLQSFDDTNAILRGNPNYWKASLPYLDEVRLLLIKDDQARWAAFLAGQMDMNYVPGIESKKAFETQQGKDYYAEWFTDVSNAGIQANTQTPPFNDPRVPLALRLLVDHQEAITAWADVYWGRGYLASTLPAALSSWEFPEDEYRSRFVEFKPAKDEAVKKAMQMLSAAGFTQANPLKFPITGLADVSFTKAHTELLQAQFARLGQGVVDASVRLLESASFTTARANSDFQYLIQQQAPNAPTEPDSWFRTFFHSKGSRNYGKYTDATLDGMIDAQRAIYDVAGRKRAVKDVIAYLIDNAPYTSWTGYYVLNAVRRNIKGFAPEGFTAAWGYNYENVWREA